MALKGKPRKSLAEEQAPDYLLQDVGARSMSKMTKFFTEFRGG